MAHREHVPAHAFGPGLHKGYRSDAIKGECPQMAPIHLGSIPLVDLIQHRSRVVPGANDQVFNMAPYGIIKLYLTWPGYPPHDPIYVDLYDGGNRPTRASVALQAATHFCRYIEICKLRKVHPTASKWRLGQGALDARNIIFNQLINTYENVWQIDCDVTI